MICYRLSCIIPVMSVSMTGFGSSECQTERGTARAEVRSVNHRFLEVQLNLPPALQARASEMRALVASQVRRARLDLWVTWEPGGPARARVVVDSNLLAELYQKLDTARQNAGIEGSVGMDVLTRFTEVARIESTLAPIDDTAYADIERCVTLALAELNGARRAEGEALVRDIRTRLDALSDMVIVAEKSSAGEIERVAARLRDRIQQLVGDAKLDPVRLHQEVAYMAEKADVSEEITRLHTHIARVRALLDGDGEVGKPLDFLVQEMGREANTLGAKSRASETAGAVLGMKAEIEKIREQARNLE